MNDYSYVAKDKSGNVIKGNVLAENTNEVFKKLSETGVFPINITENKIETKDNIANGLPDKDLLVFTRQLYILLKSGIPIVKAFKSMESSNSNAKLKYLFKNIKESIEFGDSLYASLSKHPKIFNLFYLNMIKVGETTGEIEKILLELYNYIKFEQEIKTQVKSALRYPIIVITVMVIAISIIMIFVIPTFAEMYNGLKTELPLPTRILINSSNFFVHYWYLIGIFLWGSIKWIKMLVETTEGKDWWDEYKIKMPIFGDIINKSILARFSKSFMIAIKAGVPIVQSINIVSKVIDNNYYEKKLQTMQIDIERGNSLYVSMQNGNCFDGLVLEMIATGEEAGDLESMLKEITDVYEEEIEYKLKTINSLIEPIMLVLLGGMILLFALGIFLPIWDLGGIVTKKNL